MSGLVAVRGTLTVAAGEHVFPHVLEGAGGVGGAALEVGDGHGVHDLHHVAIVVQMKVHLKHAHAHTHWFILNTAM